jgi:tRNA (guanine-N7-)-methyltransferase
MTHAERHRRKLYGRRKGPKLSPHKSQLFEALLPQLALDIRAGADARSYFGNVEDVWLEIGFGAGEHLLWQAQHHPNIGLIGAEPYESGVAKLLSRISLSPFERERVRGEGASPPIQTSQNVAPPPHHSPLPQRGNVRVHMGDARDIIEALPDAALGRVFILFPDPWPKARHAKRRFIQTEMLDALARVMKPGAELRFASDDAPLVEYTLERLTAHPSFEWTAVRASDWKARTSDWPQTRYEAKQLHGVPAFLRFRRV